jgi:hypothetical protein
MPVAFSVSLLKVAVKQFFAGAQRAVKVAVKALPLSFPFTCHVLARYRIAARTFSGISPSACPTTIDAANRNAVLNMIRTPK